MNICFLLLFFLLSLVQSQEFTKHSLINSKAFQGQVFIEKRYVALHKGTSHEDLMKKYEIAKKIKDQANQQRLQLLINRAQKQTYAGPIEIQKRFKHILDPQSDFHKNRMLKKVVKKQETTMEKIQTKIRSRSSSDLGSSSDSSSSSLGFSHTSGRSSHSSGSNLVKSSHHSYESPSSSSASHSFDQSTHEQAAFSIKMLSPKGRKTEKWLNRVGKDPNVRERFRQGLIQSKAVLEAEKADKRNEVLKKYDQKLETRKFQNPKIQLILQKLPFTIENKIHQTQKSQQKHLKSFHGLQADIETHLHYGNLHHTKGGKDDIFNFISETRDKMKNTRMLQHVESQMRS